MDNLEKEYEVIKKKLDKIIEEGDYLLAQHEIIKSYLNINEEIANLSQQLEVITKKINFNKWNSCNHMWFITKRTFDSGEGRSYDYCSCVKCNLSYEVFAEYEQRGKDVFENSQKAQMFEFLQEHNGAQYKGLSSNYFGNFNTIQSIYKEVKAANPNLDDNIILQLIKEKLIKKENKTRKRKR